MQDQATAYDSPPFRAEHIGSLLRPPELLALRRRFAAGQATQAQLTAGEDRAIAEAIALQKRLGLKLATDGEFRRSSYHSYFYRQLGDVTLEAPPTSDAASEARSGGRAAQPMATIRSRLKWQHPIHVTDFNYLRMHTDATPKVTIPGPCALHFRGGNAAVTAHAYSDVDEFWADIVESFQRELRALADAGCTYIQIDETAFAKFGDPEVQETLAARGDDWRSLIDFYIDITNRVLRGAPESLRIGMHLCRGNRAGQWHSEGSYEVVADKLFNLLDIQFYFLEYDTPRAGNFAPLALVPKTKSVILGLVSTKSPLLEGRDHLMHRMEEASRYVDIERLAVSPQCGFASVETGNPISPDIQEAKLRLVVELAEEIWGVT